MDLRVKKGDSIWKIAKAQKPEGVSTAEFVQQILDANNLDDPDKLKIGQILVVPGNDVPIPSLRADAIGRIADRDALRQEAFNDPSRAEVDREKEVIDEAYSDPSRRGDLIPQTEDEVLTIINNGETRRRKDQLASLAAELKARYGNVSGVAINGPPLPPNGEVRQARANPPEEVMLDLDVLGLTSRRVPREVPIVSPEYASLPVPRSQYVSQAAQLPSVPDRGAYTVGDPGGLIEEGNIDLGARKRVDNGDGTFSTVVSKSFEEDGVEILVPTLDPDGNSLTDDQAVQRYHDTGEHLGKFDTPESATAYAIRLSERQNAMVPRDPDNYIDLGSERWRDVFVRAPAEAAAANRKRSFDRENPKAAPAKPRPTAYRQTPNVSPEVIEQFKTKFAVPVFQPTKARNGAK